MKTNAMSLDLARSLFRQLVTDYIVVYDPRSEDDPWLVIDTESHVVVDRFDLEYNAYKFIVAAVS